MLKELRKLKATTGRCFRADLRVVDRSVRRLLCRWFGHRYSIKLRLLRWGQVGGRFKALLVCARCGTVLLLLPPAHPNCRCVAAPGTQVEVPGADREASLEAHRGESTALS